METFVNSYTNDTIVLQQRVHNPNLWEMHQNGEWIGAADYHDLLVAKLERNGFVAESQPKPTKEEFTSVVIPPDAFGALTASYRPTIETAIWDDEEVITEDPEMAAKKCLLCGQPITDGDRTVNGRTIHEACYLAQFEKPKPALDTAYWAEYARNNPPQQYAPSFGWANPEGN